MVLSPRHHDHSDSHVLEILAQIAMTTTTYDNFLQSFAQKEGGFYDVWLISGKR